SRPLRARTFAWVQTHDSLIFLRRVFDCCSGLVRQSFDSASTIVRLAFEKPSASLRENAEAMASNCRTNSLLNSNQSRVVNGHLAVRILTGSASEWLGCLVWSKAGFVLRSYWTPFGAAS